MKNDFQKKIGQQNFSALATYGNKVVIALQTGYSVCMGVCVLHACVCVCVYVPTCVYEYTCVHACVLLHECVCVCVCERERESSSAVYSHKLTKVVQLYIHTNWQSQHFQAADRTLFFFSFSNLYFIMCFHILYHRIYFILNAIPITKHTFPVPEFQILYRYITNQQKW